MKSKLIDICKKCGESKLYVPGLYGSVTIICRNLCDVDESLLYVFKDRYGFPLDSAVKIGQ